MNRSTLLSMTGFGRATATAGLWTVSAEVRSVNGRFLKTQWRLPEIVSVFESRFEALVKAAVLRGSVSASIKLESASDAPVVKVDRAKAAQYYRELIAIRNELGGEDPVNLADLLRLPGVIGEAASPTEASPDLIEAAEAALRDALVALNQMRAEEGAALSGDIGGRCNKLLELNAAARLRSPAVVDEYRQRMTDRLNRLLNGSGVEPRPEDLAREVAYFADRCDISEENQRLEHHIRTMLAALEAGGEAGKKLDFMAQEMLREANTLGSKANDGELTALVIQMKGEIEKIKEQIQNVE